MRNLLTAIVSVLCLALFSCQKEVKDIFGSTAKNNSLGLLTRTVIKNGSDSTASDYIYNGSNKIIGINTATDTSGTITTTNEIIVRNSQGIIQKIIAKSSDLMQYGIDSVIYFINYDAASHHYSNRIFSFSVLGTTITDSSAFIYDASGKIVSEEDYLDDGFGNTQNNKFDFTYTGSNMTGMKGYDITTGTAVLQITYVFEYDANPSPLVLGNEAFLLNNSFGWLSANNITKITTNLVGDPATHLTTYTYNYNTQNKPSTTNVISDGASLGVETYYYK
jgi:hypothetical protein